MAATSSWMAAALLGRVADAGVNHLKAMIAQGPINDFRATVVAVQPGLADPGSMFVWGVGYGEFPCVWATIEFLLKRTD
jgi:hypothetical protein